MWPEFGLKNVIDIALVAFFVYEAYLLMKKSGTITLFYGVVVFVALWVVVYKVFELPLLGGIFDKVMNVGFIALIVVFQREIRDFLQDFGNNKGMKFIRKLLQPKKEPDDISYIMPIVMAVINMARRKEGALIAIQQHNSLEAFVDTGETMNAAISTRLIENIFFKNSPLHDGAMIIVDKKIKAAACILPVSQSHEIPPSCGLRHRSALGLAELTDAKVIVVSEETGWISLAYNSKLYRNVSAEDLQQLLTEQEK